MISTSENSGVNFQLFLFQLSVPAGAVMFNNACINMSAPDPEFAIDDVLHEMVFLHLPESQADVLIVLPLSNLCLISTK